MTVKLSHIKPIASGFEKQVYPHPTDPSLLIKIWHDEFLERKKARHPIAIKFQRLPKYYSIINELTEQLALHEQNQSTSYIQIVTGLIDTDLGLGITVKAVRTKDGELAPTLRDLINQNRYSKSHKQALESLLNWLNNCNIIIRDFSTNNLVWDEEHHKFIIIDGIGGKSTVSLRRWIPRYNMYSNRKRIKKMRLRIQKELGKNA
jgi:hypothetical protein